MVSLPQSADADYLTDALRRSGGLGPASVCEVGVESDRHLIVLRILRLRLTYDAASNIPPMIWWSHLQRILLAVDDLGCQELLM